MFSKRQLPIWGNSLEHPFRYTQHIYYLITTNHLRQTLLNFCTQRNNSATLGYTNNRFWFFFPNEPSIFLILPSNIIVICAGHLKLPVYLDLAWWPESEIIHVLSWRGMGWKRDGCGKEEEEGWFLCMVLLRWLLTNSQQSLQGCSRAW